MHSNFLYFSLFCHWNICLPLIFSYLNSSNIFYSPFNLFLWTKWQLWKAEPTSYVPGQSHCSWWSHKELPVLYCKSDFTLTATLMQWWPQQNIKDQKFMIIHLNLMFSTKQPDQFSRIHVPILILFIACDISVPESEQITDPNKEPWIITSSRYSQTNETWGYPHISFTYGNYNYVSKLFHCIWRKH